MAVRLRPPRTMVIFHPESEYYSENLLIAHKSGVLNLSSSVYPQINNLEKAVPPLENKYFYGLK